MTAMHRFTVIVDNEGNPLGATLVTDYETDHELVHPMTVGPFDTAQDVFERLFERLDRQLSLFYNRS